MLPKQGHPIQMGHSLPVPQTTFVGRKQAVEELRRLLAAGRLLTITGSAGSGKTRLALRVAEMTLDAFGDGVWWVDLAPLGDPLLVPQAVASALHLRERSGASYSAQLVDYLRGRSLLLVLDNCEHLRDACAELVSALFAGGCTVALLATSLLPLAVKGEQVWSAPTLAVPDPLTCRPLEEWQAAEAVRLFVERARSIPPAFTLNERNGQTVVEICWRLDGLPLAIELAAARVNVLTPKQILPRLDNSLQLLTRSAPASESRHQTLRAALAWSFGLLDGDEQRLFPRLAVFRGGFDYAAVEAICTGAGIEPDALLNVLAGLVEKSLVTAAEQGDEMRYRLLEPVRQYAVERLYADGEEADWLARHARWYLDLADQIKPTAPGLEQQR
ncbi:MAG TPA: AAA family ATPase, partial [Caldilineaceae bacterium]|nr:AAA family ATPase [Caldilineaceae bacterium]